MAEIVSGGHDRLGDAVLAAQAAYAETGVMPELLAVYHLFGDPGHERLCFTAQIGKQLNLPRQLPTARVAKGDRIGTRLCRLTAALQPTQPKLLVSEEALGGNFFQPAAFNGSRLCGQFLTPHLELLGTANCRDFSLGTVQ